MTLLHSDGTGDATTTMCHRYTPPEQLPVMTKTADIVVVATGMYYSSIDIVEIKSTIDIVGYVVYNIYDSTSGLKQVFSIFGRCDTSHQGGHDQGGSSCY
jgi:hypothetical protein